MLVFTVQNLGICRYSLRVRVGLWEVLRSSSAMTFFSRKISNTRISINQWLLVSISLISAPDIGNISYYLISYQVPQNPIWNCQYIWELTDIWNHANTLPYILTSDQLANPFTKYHTTTPFKYLLDNLSMFTPLWVWGDVKVVNFLRISICLI